MFTFIKTFEERVADEVKKIEAEAAAKKAAIEAKVKADEEAAKEAIIAVWDEAIHAAELGIVNSGLALDTEADDALAVIKHKLSAFKDTLQPQLPDTPTVVGEGH